MELWMIIPIFIFLDLLLTYIVFSISDFFIEVNPLFFALIQRFGPKGIFFGGIILLPIICFLSPCLPREAILFLSGAYFVIFNVHCQNFIGIATGAFSNCPYMKEDGKCEKYSDNIKNVIK